MSSERRDGASEHVGISPDILQPIININDGLNTKDVSGHHVLDQKITGHATEDDPNDRALCSATVPITSVDERSGRESPDIVYSVWLFCDIKLSSCHLLVVYCRTR